MVFDINHGVERERIVDPADEIRQKSLAGLAYTTLLEPIVRSGKRVVDPSFGNAMEARERCREQLDLLDESQKRILNPHSYPGGLEYGHFHRRQKLVSDRLGNS